MIVELHWWFMPIVLILFGIVYYRFEQQRDDYLPNVIGLVVLAFSIVLSIGIVIGHYL